MQSAQTTAQPPWGPSGEVQHRGSGHQSARRSRLPIGVSAVGIHVFRLPWDFLSSPDKAGELSTKHRIFLGGQEPESLPLRVLACATLFQLRHCSRMPPPFAQSLVPPRGDMLVVSLGERSMARRVRPIPGKGHLGSPLSLSFLSSTSGPLAAPGVSAFSVP